MSDKGQPVAEQGDTKVEIYTRRYCGYCVRAKLLLESKNIAYTELSLDAEPALREVMLERSGGGYTVPQIFINNLAVGGCTELFALEQQGRLDEMLAEE